MQFPARDSSHITKRIYEKISPLITCIPLSILLLLTTPLLFSPAQAQTNFPTPHASPNPSIPAISPNPSTAPPRDYLTPNFNPDVPRNQHTYAQAIIIEVISSTFCLLTGIDPVDPAQGCLDIDPQTRKLGLRPPQEGEPAIGGLLGMTPQMFEVVYTPPASAIEHVQYLAGNFGIVKPAQAQTGGGFKALKPIQDIWIVMRNMTYLLLVLIFILIGLGIMLRLKIDPRTVMNLQNQIPHVIVSILLITFSYAIVGLMIDFMWLSTYAGVNLIMDAVPQAAATIPGSTTGSPPPASGPPSGTIPSETFSWVDANLRPKLIDLIKNEIKTGQVKYNGPPNPSKECKTLTQAEGVEICAWVNKGVPVMRITGAGNAWQILINNSEVGLYEHLLQKYDNPGAIDPGTPAGMNPPCDDKAKLKDLANSRLQGNPLNYFNSIFQGKAWNGICALGIQRITANVSKGVGEMVAGIVQGFLIGDAAANFNDIKCWTGWREGISPSGCISLLFGHIATVLVVLFILATVLLLLFRVWFELLKAYVMVIIYAITGPIWIFMGLLPSRPLGFEKWLRRVAANLIVFPAMALLLVTASVLMTLFNKVDGSTFVAPFIGSFSGSTLGSIIAFGILLVAPGILKIIKDSMQAAGKQGQMATQTARQSVGAGAGFIGGTGEGVRKRLFWTHPMYGPGIGHRILSGGPPPADAGRLRKGYYKAYNMLMGINKQQGPGGPYPGTGTGGTHP